VAYGQFLIGISILWITLSDDPRLFAPPSSFGGNTQSRMI
jgi:hypothetical protein